MQLRIRLSGKENWNLKVGVNLERDLVAEQRLCSESERCGVKAFLLR